jgi:hypothetical protein
MHRDERITAIAAMFDCAPALAAQVEPSMQAVSFAHKAVLAHQGDPSEHCWLVIGGTVHIQVNGIDGQRVQLAYHGPGEFFGPIPNRPPTARTWWRMARSICCAFAAPNWRRWLTASQRWRWACQTVGAPARSVAGPDGRADHAFGARSHPCGIAAAGGCEYRIVPAPQITALALNANTARETASRAVSALERRGSWKGPSEA